VSVNENADEDAELLENRNPFLAKLIPAYLQDVDKEDAAAVRRAADTLTDDISDIEMALRGKMHGTLTAATRVMDAITAKLKTGEDFEGSSSKEQKLLAMISLLKAQNERLQRLDDRAKIEGLATRLADKEDELLVAHRKILQYQANSSAPSAKAKDAPSSAAAAAQPTAGGGMKEEEGATVTRDEVEHLTKVLADRNAELDAKEAALVKAERYGCPGQNKNRSLTR
jgi:hypothetical protein